MNFFPGIEHVAGHTDDIYEYRNQKAKKDQAERDRKAGIAKTITFIAIFGYVITIPLVICPIKEIVSWFTGEEYCCVFEIFANALALSLTAPIFMPLSVITAIPIAFGIIDSIYETSKEQRLFGGGALLGGILGALHASKKNKRR